MAALHSIRLRVWLPLMILASVLVACASPPPVASVSLPPIPAGQARVWFYRVYDPTESLGRPLIYMNGAIAGIADQGRAFYRDMPAGWYRITVESTGRDLFQSQYVGLAAGEQAYVKILSLRSWVQGYPGFGRDTFYVALIPPPLGAVEIADYPFIGGG
jgi:hypothetical protein